MEPEPARYPDVDPQPDFAAIEAEVLRLWEAGGTFKASVENRPAGPGGANKYVFYDGPPFANGLPHTGNLLTGYVKDVIPRYRTMRGQRVERRFGWDCHGLPPEMEAEKELGLAGRRAITDYGIERFNAHCRSSVMRYTDEWQRYVNRQARWVDFDNDYKTMDLPFMESVLWAFKRLWEKDLIYESHRVLPYSWGAETPLSNFEIRMDDATRPRTDPAITVAFRLLAAPGDPAPLHLWAWTTTPWTLPSNLALAVDPDTVYAVLEEATESGPRRHVLAAEAVERYARQLSGARPAGSVRGRELIGRRYEPLFDYFAETPGGFAVLGADFVDTAEGTGIVHMAPGFGEEDQALCAEAGIGVVVPVCDQGRFTAEVTDWAGQNVFDANSGIIAALKARGLIVRHDSHVHNYPHCWRTDTPVIYRAVNSWYVRVTAIRDRMVELNRQINWIPAHVRDGRFGNWLEGARDWSISRNRFWGSPVPVWRSDDPAWPRTDVYGSLEEIERDFGVRPDDLHRPFVDSLVRPNPDDPTGQSVMRRVPEVLDCWFESGSMPYAQVHYPFENKEWFESHFPADFIVEYVNQTRGWFYTLHVLATALFDRPPFRNAVCHGVVLAADGAKLSKRLRNYTDPEVIFATQGADALRWYLMSSPVLRGGDLRMSDEGIDAVVRGVLRPLWNAYVFFCLYANADRSRGNWNPSSCEVLDRYVLTKTRNLVVAVAERLDSYDLAGACAEIEAFCGTVNNWYIRRSRDRFWAPAGEGDPANKQAAYDTLYTVLVTLVQVAAPLLPLVCESIHRGLGGAASVHLCDWPDAAALPDDDELVGVMDRAREVCSAALGVRVARGLPARQPLRSARVAGRDAAALAPFTELIAAEINVKSVMLSDELDEGARFVLRPRGEVLGPLLGPATQAVMAAARSGEWRREPDGTVTVAGHSLSVGQFDLVLETAEDRPCAALPTADLVVTLDVELDDELRAEGAARRLVRVLQQSRRDRGLHVADRIELTLDLPAELAAALAPHQIYVASQVLAAEVRHSDLAGAAEATTASIDGQEIRFAIARSETAT
ncbi:MAG: isoleucine--tRNA ligase [Acidimicrobiia bacterium]|nr:isoleucine--tRNA ligase [Acidimicrobiia bacterium]